MNIYKKYLNKYRLPFITAICCVFLEAMCDLLQPTVMSRIIDVGVKSGEINTVINYGLIMLGITALGACFAASRSILASRVSQSFGADLRAEVFEKIINFSEESADRIESGSLITRVTNDTNQVTQFINGLMRIFFKAPVTCLGSIILAVMLSVNLSFILFIVVAVVTVLIVISMRLSYTRFALVQKSVDKVNIVVQEYLMGVRLVKAFGRYKDEEEKFDYANSNLSEKTVSSQLVISYFSPLLSLSVNLGIAAIIYAGSILFGSGSTEVGKVAAFVSYMAQILVSLIMITNIFNTFVRTKASTERINEILASEEDFKGHEQEVSQKSIIDKININSWARRALPAKPTPCGFAPLRTKRGARRSEQNRKTGGKPKVLRQAAGSSEIAFDHVTFAYPNGSGLPAIKDLSFKAVGGETLAIIGPTGSGKSTIAWLCLRFYDAGKGSIYLNGTDVKSLASDTIRGNIALAPQKSMLFTGTIFENITWGNDKATREDALKAALIAEADGFIQNMPSGYDSVLGQGGVNLSGGQKQRISIARALAKDSPILILDDCTSALDAVTEAKIRRSLKTVNEQGKMVIIITQRIGTAMSADRILVMDNGISVGYGKHEELLHSCETYRSIYDSQIGRLDVTSNG